MQSAKQLDASHDAYSVHALNEIDFSQYSTVIVALSGGSDSTALLHLVWKYLRGSSASADLLAVTVDHGLRSGSASEAVRVGQMCANFDINHRIVKWKHAHITAGIQQKARMARYRLLSDVARTKSNALVLTGHTYDDDAETRYMRAMRHTAEGEVEGISAFTLFENQIWFARPLLCTRKIDLQAYLVRHNIGWIDDPSNENTQFERVAVRKMLHNAGKNGLHSLNRSTQAGEHISSSICQLLANEALTVFDQTHQVIKVGIEAREHNGLTGAVRVLLGYVGKTEYLPPIALVNKAVEAVFSGPNKSAFTLNGCTMQRRGDCIQIRREPRRKTFGEFGFDKILPDRDFEIAQTLRSRLGLSKLPEIPRKGAVC